MQIAHNILKLSFVCSWLEAGNYKLRPQVNNVQHSFKMVAASLANVINLLKVFLSHDYV